MTTAPSMSARDQTLALKIQSKAKFISILIFTFTKVFRYGFILLHYLISRYAVGNWLGEGDSFTVVDTPGFGDSDNDDNLLIDEVY